jgi:hypothetical protein
MTAPLAGLGQEKSQMVITALCLLESFTVKTLMAANAAMLSLDRIKSLSEVTVSHG